MDYKLKEVVVRVPYSSRYVNPDKWEDLPKYQIARRYPNVGAYEVTLAGTLNSDRYLGRVVAGVTLYNKESYAEFYKEWEQQQLINILKST